MSLRWKTVIVVAITAVIAVGVGFAASQSIFMRSFQAIEDRNTTKAVEQMTGVLMARIKSLHTLNHDWAAWDDTYNFVQRPSENRNYIESNPTDSTFVNAELNFILIVDTKGNLVFGKAFDLNNNKEIPIPGSVDELFSDTLLHHSSVNDSVSGIVLLPEGPLLISSQPIITSQGEGPIMGTIMMAQYLDSGVIEALSSAEHLPLYLVTANDPNMPPGFQIALSSISEDAPVLTSPVDSTSIAGYALLNDIYGKPALILRTAIARDVYASGTSTMRYFLIGLLLMAVLVGVLLYYALGRLVISRVGRIGSYVSDIGASADLTKRLPTEGNDELSMLGRNINVMVETLQKSEQALKAKQQAEQKLRLTIEIAEQNFQSSIDNSPLGILIDTADNEHLYANRALLDIYGFSSVEEFDSIPASKRLTPASFAVHQERMERRKRGEPVPSDYEISIIRKDGGIGHLHASSKELQWNGRTQLQVVFQDITERKQKQEEMRRANEKLSVLVNKLEVQNRFNNILSEMRDMLQVCSSVKETAPVVSSSAQKIFPGTQGALFLISESKPDLEIVARWGDSAKGEDENAFTHEDCWGLRTGRPHVVGDVGSGPVCAHVTQSPAGGYMCLPLTAKGNVIGLLHIRDGNLAGGGSAQSLLGLSDIAVSLSEQLSLAMSNVKLTETLSYQSIRDPLSGLFNRRYMEESLTREIARAERKNTQIGVIMADLDHLKIFNDSYGHAAGDLLVSHVGRVFRNGIRSSDIACRYGGEEFVIILSESSLDDTLKRASALNESVKKIEPIFQGQLLDRVTVSMGVAAYPQHGATVSDLLRAADTALYRAKQGGRDRVVASG